MKVCAAALLIGLASLSAAERRALLVAIDSYPIVQGRQLSGSAYDLRLMRKMLEFYGFQPDQLARADATRQAIITKLATMARDARPGDEVVFYFSGRGSIAPPPDRPAAKSQLEPTLVPFDGKATSTDFDVRMKRIEDWAQEVAAKGANVTIVIDASFQSATRDDVGRPYNPTPRTIARKATLGAEVRDTPYLGPGAYLAATPSGGSAYEYLVNASKDTWAGAFTDMLVNQVVSQVRRGAAPTYSDALREVQAYFKDKVRQDYMPGLTPYPFPKVMSERADRYDRPMFGGLAAGGIPPAQTGELKQMDDDRRAREKKLRVGLSFPAVRSRSGPTPRDADDMERDRDPELVAQAQRYAATKLPFVEIEPAGAPVDVIVSLVKQTEGGIEARIAGDEVDRARNLRFTGASVAAVMEAGLSGALEQKALTLRIFRLIERGTSTWNPAFTIKADRGSYKPNENFAIDIAAPEAALLYIFDRDDADGIVQLTLPASDARDHRLETGTKRLEGQIEEGSPTGKMLVQALFVDAPALPPLDGEFGPSLLRHLRALAAGLEGGTIRWCAKRIDLAIDGG